MIATLPMYDWPELRDANEALWECLRDAFRQFGFDAPKHLSQADENESHWLRSDLMFSQTCGYPFALNLNGQVDLLATPVYDVQGCGKGTYRSAVVVSKNALFQTMESTQGTRLVYNDANSLSGFQCLKPKVGNPNAWFSDLLESGSHRQSAQSVAHGRCDIAAIDAICWAYIQRYDVEVAEQLRVLEWTDEFPALPFISAKSVSKEELELKQLALDFGIQQSSNSCQTKPLLLNGVTTIPIGNYIDLKDLVSASEFTETMPCPQS